MREIAETGGIGVDDYMRRSNAAYYAQGDPLGRAGDFVTAPEISQMFGELIGAWIADLWQRAGAPAPVQLVEYGPGRGTLMTDALRMARRVPGFAAAAQIVFVETSPALANLQRAAVPEATIVAAHDEVPAGVPSIAIANEFFDALAIEQQVLVDETWKERRIGANGDLLRFDPAGDTIRECSPAREEIAAAIAARIVADGGAALIVDYGYANGETGDTLQAIRRHEYVDPLAHPGTADLTAHVDFVALEAAARRAGARISGPVSQAGFLTSLGIGARAEMLMQRADGTQREAVATAMRRLTAPDEMGALFKAMALTAPSWPLPAGFPA
ncbi:MAG: SAM-dependent methyltransferase [Pseudomonadota bacterium]